MLGGNDVTHSLRSPLVNQHVSAVSALPGVRTTLLQLQRRMALPGNIVMAGRDIGSVVLPNAHLKIFLTADPEERARRRHRQQRKGQRSTYDATLASLKQRDNLDSSRCIAPRTIAPDAVVIDTTRLRMCEVLSKVLAAVRVVAGKHGPFENKGGSEAKG